MVPSRIRTDCQHHGFCAQCHADGDTSCPYTSGVTSCSRVGNIAEVSWVANKNILFQDWWAWAFLRSREKTRKCRNIAVLVGIFGIFEMFCKEHIR